MALKAEEAAMNLQGDGLEAAKSSKQLVSWVFLALD